MRRASLPIDSMKFRNAFKLRGEPLSHVGPAIGYGHAFANNVIKRECITASATKLIEMYYHLPYDAYKPEEEVQEQPVVEESTAVNESFDYDKLYHIIYGAVYEAMKKALE